MEHQSAWMASVADVRKILAKLDAMEEKLKILEKDIKDLKKNADERFHTKYVTR